MKTLFRLLLLLVMFIVVSATPSHADLIDRGGGMIYDTDLNITWLQDANYARTSGFSADGLLDWNTATLWAENLVYGGFGDWRLPSSLNGDGTGPCFLTDCTGSEMGHLYYTELGNTAFLPGSIPPGGCNVGVDCGLVNVGPFVNLQFAHWSSTAFDPVRDVSLTGTAWDFDFVHGVQGVGVGPLFAWAVRDGDVVSAVPVPPSLLLLGSGVVAFALIRRRFR